MAKIKTGIFVKTLITSTIASCAFFLASCGSADKHKEASYPMGVILPLSGYNSECANQVFNGMKIAAAQINANGGVGGVPLVLDVKDSGDKEYVFHDAFNALSRNGAKIFNIGFGQDCILIQKRLATEDSIFINWFSTYAPITLDCKNCTRIFLNGAQEGDIMAKSVDRSDNKEKQLVIMNVNNLSGKSDADYLAFNLKLDKTNLYRDVFSEGEKRFNVFAEQIARLYAEYVFYVGYGQELQAFINSLQTIEFKGDVIASRGLSTQKISVPNYMRLFRVESLFEQGRIDSKVSKDFVAEYKKIYGTSPTVFAAYGYDSVMLLMQAAKEAKYNPKSMRTYFENKTYDCAVGKIKFDNAADSYSELELVRQK